MSNISAAYTYCVNVCNAPNVGYSQTYRNRRKVNGVTYFDCSSLIYYCLCEGGFPLDPNGWPFATSGMCDVLLSLGFVEIDITSPWLPGDIVWREGHTEMVYNERVTMGAHSSSYALDKQVSINTYSTSPSNWMKCFRYGSGAQGGSYTPPTTWIKGNYYLSQAEMENNAEIIFYYLDSKGWSVNAIAGLLGNMQSESTINPGIWQSLKEGVTNLGFGLVQWTPSTNYTNWARDNGYSIDDGYGQLYWIHYLSASLGQWIPTDDYPLSWEEFKTSVESVDYLTMAFLKNFERAGVEAAEKRKKNAQYWYRFLIALPEIHLNDKKKRKAYNFLLFNRRRRIKR